ncbi:MAG: hypothetical protein Q8920_17535, partial [Bacillota bacterium]|nr:hypothetical protein [Bacillota bacterium]
MISVFYGTNLISMFLAVLFEKFFKGRIMTIVYLLFSATSVVWFMYALTDNFLLVLLLQSIEGTLLAVCGIFLGSFLQTVPNKDYVARVSGVNDIINNSGKLVGILAAYLISVIGFTRFVFTINSVFLFLSSAAFITGGHKVFLERKA